MKKTALTASAITLLASGVGLGDEASATASALVTATASLSASSRVCQHNSSLTCDWGILHQMVDHGWQKDANGVNTWYTKTYYEQWCSRQGCGDSIESMVSWSPSTPPHPW